MRSNFVAFIKGLALEMSIGVHAWEKKIRQQISLDLEMESNQKFVFEQLSTCIDYAKIFYFIKDFVEKNSFDLLESFADELSVQLQKNFSLKKIKLTIEKPYVFPQTQSAGITLIREF